MSEDYKLPEGFVNPVPEPGEKKPRRTPRVSVPSSSPINGEAILKGIGVLIALAFVFSGTIMNSLESPIQDAVDAAEEWAGIAADGTIELDDSSVTAVYTPSSGESTSEDDHEGSTFTASQWQLTNSGESITLRDYNFDQSPVENDSVTQSYYAASAKEVNARVGKEVDIDPITIDGRRGMVWRSDLAKGEGWVLLAEFPGDPSTVRLGCETKSSDTTVAKQCEQVLSSLQFGE
jgi:hypothetical protein